MALALLDCDYELDVALPLSIHTLSQDIIIITLMNIITL